MDGSLFDRITKLLIDAAPRRQAVRAAAGASLAAVAARFGVDDAGARKKKRKKRCRKIGQTCGSGNGKCCNNSAVVRCEEFSNLWCQGVELTGFRCCGQVGARCDPTFGTTIDPSPISGGNCSCCADFYCGKQLDGVYRCQTDDT
jgi:hypothetical protein